MNWSEVGHTKQKEHLERLIDAGRLSHAYLFAGTEMIGKRMVAEDIAQVLVPVGYEPDVMRLAPEHDAETGKIRDISIEQTKQLKSWISLRPLGAYKAIIIDDADRLGTEAANNLLKVVEEPPTYAHFFLISGKPGQVMPTIASRCERLDFHPLDTDSMRQILVGHKLDADDRQLVTAVAAGRPGLALRLIREKHLPAVAKAIAELSMVLKGGTAEKVLYAKKLADDAQASDIVSWWLSYVHHRLADKPHLAPIASGLLDLASVLEQPQYNRRLAVEHFLLTNSVQN